jgi:Asp-tRNA(Asn)/Glu-tRNA(Gln) amidotransferase A subunit family amidase
MAMIKRSVGSFRARLNRRARTEGSAWTMKIDTILKRIAANARAVEEIADVCCTAVKEREAEVQAWAYFDADKLRQDARNSVTQGRGPLDGVPIGVKDIIDTADMPTSYGSPIYTAYQPKNDAACVARLREAGALIAGKTVTTEFAATYPGKTRNPYNSAHTPGGSSSGSAAAVAAGMVPAALATQTMGSLIRPAAYCGIVGYKPSFGTINRAGVKPQAESFDTIGVMANSVDDAACVASVLVSGRSDLFAKTRTAPPKIGVYRGPDWSKAEAPGIEALEKAAARLSDLGAFVTDVEAPALLKEAFDIQPKLVFFELARGLSDEWRRFKHMLSPELSYFIEGGLNTSYATFLEADDIARRARACIDDCLKDVDAWLTLSAPGEAPAGMATGDVTFNRLWTFLHLPALTIPAGFGPNRLPLGVQLLGRYRADTDLIAVSRWVEAALAP